MTTLEEPTAVSSAIHHGRQIETPANKSNTRTQLANLGVIAVMIALVMEVFAVHSWDSVDRGLALVAITIFITIAQWKFSTIKLKLTLSHDGIVETLKSGKSRTIPWSDLEEYYCGSDSRGFVGIRVRLKSDGKTIRYDSRRALISQRESFEAFADALSAKIDAIDRAEDTLVSNPSDSTGLLAGNNARASTAPGIKSGTSFYDKPIAKVIAVVCCAVYVISFFVGVFSFNGGAVPRQDIYVGVSIAFFTARVFRNRPTRTASTSMN